MRKFSLNFEATGKKKMPNIHELHYTLLAYITLHISTDVITIWSVVLLSTHFVTSERQEANLGIRLPPYALIKITKVQTESDVTAPTRKQERS